MDAAHAAQPVAANLTGDGPMTGRKRRRGMRPDVLQAVHELRQAGHDWHQIAAVLRHRFGYNPLQAIRLAHGWSQRDAADEWCRRWPDDIKTFKNFSYWERWLDCPAAGHALNVPTLDRLAQLYECHITDLLDGHGNHRPRTAQPPPPAIVRLDPERHYNIARIVNEPGVSTGTVRSSQHQARATMHPRGGYQKSTAQDT